MLWQRRLTVRSPIAQRICVPTTLSVRALASKTLISSSVSPHSSASRLRSSGGILSK